jgi:hypothetical protein
VSITEHDLRRSLHEFADITVSDSDLRQARHSLQERMQQPRVARRQVLIAAAVVAVLVTVMALWWEARQDPRALRPAGTTTQSALGSPTTRTFPAGPNGPETVPTVGFIGLPPLSAVPSSPERGVLVDEWPLFGGSPPWRGGAQLYEDGRLIWFLFYGGSAPPYVQQSTGYLEQRLSPEGVDLVRRNVGVSRDPWQLENRLPDTAWADRAVKAYVPTRYGVCVKHYDPSGSGAEWGVRGSPPRLDDLLAALPESVAELIRGKPLVPPLDDAEDCLAMTVAEARVLDRALQDAVVSASTGEAWRNRYVLHYDVPSTSKEGWQVHLRFEPVYPDGSVGCSNCG